MDEKQYDGKLADDYEISSQRPLRKFAYEPTVQHYVENYVRGKTVCDLACGEGVSSRMIKSLGAREVVGIDISKDLIAKAKSKSPDLEFHIRNCVNDDLQSFGKFDLVTAIMLLNYPSGKEELNFVAQNIKKLLYSGGTFFAMVVNPFIEPHGYDEYGIKIITYSNESEPPIKIEISYFSGKKLCEFEEYFWKMETYRKAFEDNGFRVEFLPGIVSDAGIREYGEKFWQNYLKNPIYYMIKGKLN